MASILDFQSIYEEDVNSIRARVEAAADTDIDKRAGEIFYDITSPIIFEIERLWDSLNYYAALTFLPWSNGIYLDYKGLYEIGLARLTATTATGVVTFVGDRGTFISSGTIVSNTPQVVDDELYQFQTLADEEIGMSAPFTAPTVVAGGTGTVVSGTGLALEPLRYAVSFVGRGGETEMGPASSGLSVNNKVILLTDIPVGPAGTTSRKIWRMDNTSGDFRLLTTLANNTTTVYTDTLNTLLATAVAPATNTTDRVDIDCESLNGGIDNNLGSSEVDQLVDSIDGVASVLNDNPFVSGTDEETDEEYQARLIFALSSDAGQGNKADYIRWAKTVDGVDGAAVIPQWDGDNTVKVILVGPDNTAVSAAVVSEVQELLDPDSDGSGQGYAPVGAEVTVVSVAQVNISVSATITHESQYSLDGANGTSATRDEIVDSINAYFRSLPAGGDVIWAEVLARVITVDGVADVSSFQINSGTANVAIADNQVPTLISHTFV